jgi:hypothetical protein
MSASIHKGDSRNAPGSAKNDIEILGERYELLASSKVIAK